MMQKFRLKTGCRLLLPLCVAGLSACRDNAAPPAPGDGAETRPVVITNYVAVKADIDKIMGDAAEAMIEGFDANGLAKPAPAPAATGDAAELRGRMLETAKELSTYMGLKQEYENQLHAEDGEVKDLYGRYTTAKKQYDDLLAERLVHTTVLGKIHLLTKRQQYLSAQLRKLEEKQ